MAKKEPDIIDAEIEEDSEGDESTDIAIIGDEEDEDGSILTWHSYPQFREFIRRIPCVVCQLVYSRQNKDTGIEFDYVPELIHVSDPHHVKSRGAGGPDAENLVPLCRKHHTLWDEFGPTEFQVRFNVNLKETAVELYERFISSDSLEENADKVYAYHQRILSHIAYAEQATARAAFEICEFADRKWDGRPSYKWLGFNTFGAYATAPTDQGGLGLRERTAYRMLAMARIKALLPDSIETIQKLGSYKSEVMFPVLKKEQDKEKRKALCEAAIAMPLADVISWKNSLSGIKDKRESLRDKIYKVIEDFLSSKGFKDEEETDKLTWLIMKEIGRSGQGKSQKKKVEITKSQS